MVNKIFTKEEKIKIKKIIDYCSLKFTEFDFLTPSGVKKWVSIAETELGLKLSAEEAEEVIWRLELGWQVPW